MRVRFETIGHAIAAFILFAVAMALVAVEVVHHLSDGSTVWSVLPFIVAAICALAAGFLVDRKKTSEVVTGVSAVIPWLAYVKSGRRESDPLVVTAEAAVPVVIPSKNEPEDGPPLDPGA